MRSQNKSAACQAFEHRVQVSSPYWPKTKEIYVSLTWNLTLYVFIFFSCLTFNFYFNQDPPPQKPSMGLLASLTAKITPNKSQNQQHQQQQQSQIQNDYDRSRNEPIYQRRGSNQSNQYYEPVQQPQQQQPIYVERQIDGKNQVYSQSSNNHQYNQHQYNSIYNQNIYVSTNPFITPTINNYSPSSFGKDITGNYSSNGHSWFLWFSVMFSTNLTIRYSLIFL